MFSLKAHWVLNEASVCLSCCRQLQRWCYYSLPDSETVRGTKRTAGTVSFTPVSVCVCVCVSVWYTRLHLILSPLLLVTTDLSSAVARELFSSHLVSSLLVLFFLIVFLLSFSLSLCVPQGLVPCCVGWHPCALVCWLLLPLWIYAKYAYLNCIIQNN